VVEQCWQQMSAGAGIEEVLDALLRRGLRNLPSFAVAHLGTSGPRVAVRLGGQVTFTTVAGADTVRAPSGPPWTEHDLPAECTELTLRGGGGAGGHSLPMAAGVTLAASISIRFGSPRAGVDVPPISVPPLASAVEPARHEPLAEQPPPEKPAEPFVPGIAEPATEPSVPEIAEPALEPAAVPGDDSYDDLFGATQRPIPIEQLGIQAEAPAPPPASLPRDTLAPPPEVLAEIHFEPPPPPAAAPPPAPVDAPAPAAPTQAGMLIDSVPWLGKAAPAVPSPVPSPVPPATNPLNLVPPPPAHGGGADPGHTVSRSALRASEATAPTVVAAQCPNGHLTAMHAPLCRVCGAQVADQEGREVARPSLGVLRFSTGESIALDRGILIGRAPTRSDGMTQVHLLQLASPDNDLSRNHAEILLDGWHVAVKDLGSLNGTTVTLPGQQPVRLRKGDPHLLEHGAVIVLADVITCVYEVT
jgi:hypothetical protein